MGSEGNGTKITIRKYPNRRLYDTSRSRYVNIAQIGELVKEGGQVEVIDSTSGEDITKVILAQIIIEEEKGKRSLLPAEFLHQLIQDGESAYARMAEEMVASSVAAYKTAQERMETAITGWVNPWLETFKPYPISDLERLKARVAELEAEVSRLKR